MSDQSRNRILERIREGLPATPFPGSDFSVVEEKQWPLETRVKMLRERLESVNGQVHQCSRDGWFERSRHVPCENSTREVVDHGVQVGAAAIK